MVEKIAGKSLGGFLAERIWNPLGMADTSFTIPADKHARFAKALPNDPDTGRPQSVLDLTKPLKMECGGGCAASTAGDYIRFAQMLLDRGRLGERQIVAPKTIEFMTADHLGPSIQNNGAPGYGFGLGFAVRRGTGVAGTTGSPATTTGAAPTALVLGRPQRGPDSRLHGPRPGPTRLHYRKLMTTLVNQAIVD